MNRILTIALHEIRFAIRSRLIASLACLSVAIVLILPRALKDDGTTAGHQHVLLFYTLTAVMWILSTGTLIWGATAISRERKLGPLVLLATKPLAMSSYWLGKLLGIVTAMTAIALFCILLILLQVLSPLKTLSENNPRMPSTAGALFPHHIISPLPDNLDPMVDRVIASLKAKQELSVNGDTPEFRAQIKQQLQRQRTVVEPGQSRQWVFRLPQMEMNETSVLEARFESLSLASRMPMTGRWTVSSTPDSEPIISLVMSNFYGGTFPIPLTADTFNSMPGEFVLRYDNGTDDISSTAAFPSSGAIHLMFHGGSFAVNLLITILFMGSVLTILAALGLFCSACFESPTAVFTSVVLVVTVLIASGTAALVGSMDAGHGHDHGHEESHFIASAEYVNETIAETLAPLTNSRVIANIASGLAMSLRAQLLPALLSSGLIAMGLFLPAILILKRREIEILERSGTR